MSHPVQRLPEDLIKSPENSSGIFADTGPARGNIAEIPSTPKTREDQTPKGFAHADVAEKLEPPKGTTAPDNWSPAAIRSLSRTTTNGAYGEISRTPMLAENVSVVAAKTRPLPRSQKRETLLAIPGCTLTKAMHSGCITRSIQKQTAGKWRQHPEAMGIQDFIEEESSISRTHGTGKKPTAPCPSPFAWITFAVIESASILNTLNW